MTCESLLGPVVRIAWNIPGHGAGATSWMYYEDYLRSDLRVDDLNARFGCRSHWLEFFGDTRL